MSDSPKPDDKHVDAYERMLERTRHFLEVTEDDLSLKLHYAVDAAKDKAHELGELSREEAEKVADYLRRDIHDAAEYLTEEGKVLNDWLRFDIELIEQRFMDWFSEVVDTTKLELLQLANRDKQVALWQSGEVSGPGTLVCEQCGHQQHFHHSTKIPPCPQCGHTTFYRHEPQND